MVLHKIGKLFRGFFIAVIVCTYSVSFAAEDNQTWEERYKSEPYVTLLKEVTVKVNADYSFITTTHMIEKIQQESGKKRGEIAIDYDRSREEITALEAFTIMPNGTKLPYEKMQELDTAQGSGVYSDERTKAITMPNVVIGSMIDWKTIVVSKKPVIEKNFFDSFRMSCYCPIKEARYTITTPKNMKLNIKNLNNEIEPTVSTSGDEVTYTWYTSNVEKDDDEENMPSPEERYKRVTVSTLENWKQFSGWAWSLFEKNIKISPEMKEKVKELTIDKKTTPEKIQAIIQYLQDNFRYVSMSIESHSYEPHPTNQVFSNKYGDCKDQTLLAIALLSEAGIKARPVFLSTHSELNRRDLLPMPFYFDHVILTFDLEGKKYYTDILFKGYPFQKMPVSYAGKGILLVNEKGGDFTAAPLPDNGELVTTENGKVIVKDDATAAVELTITFPRSTSIMLRETLKTQSTDIREKLLARIGKSIAEGGNVTKLDFINEKIPYSQLSLAMLFDDPTIIQKVGDMMLFGLPQIKRGSTFLSPKRRYPIVISHEAKTETTIDFHIPDGYEIVSVPKEISIDTPFANFNRKYSTKGSEITAKESLCYKRVRMPAEEYHTVQSFLDSLPKSTNDKIVIKKKTVL